MHRGLALPVHLGHVADFQYPPVGIDAVRCGGHPPAPPRAPPPAPPAPPPPRPPAPPPSPPPPPNPPPAGAVPVPVVATTIITWVPTSRPEVISTKVSPCTPT